MPFQDIDEVSTTEYNPPGLLERWVRKIFVEDWGLKLLALAITLVLWMAVTSANKPVTIRTAVQLNFIRPDNLEIGNEPPKSVDVLLTGSRNKLDRISLLDLVATVDVSDLQAGERAVRLTTDRVQMNLPDGIRIEAFQPSTIPVRLDPIVERQVPIEVKIDGKPAEGYELYSARPSIAVVVVRGPASNVNALEKVPTETVSIEGRKESFTVSHVALDVSDHRVDLEESSVDVAIEIGQRRVEKTFTGIVVRSPLGFSIRK